MEDENYKQLLDKLEKQAKTIEGLSKKIADVVAFNKALLDREPEKSKEKTQEDSKADEDKLFKEIFLKGDKK